MRILGESTFRQFFENSPLAMWIYDLADLRFLAVNKAACRQYEYSQAEFVTMTLRDMRGPEHMRRFDEAMALADAQGTSGPPSLWEHRTKSGRRILVEVMANIIDFEDLRAGIGVLRDVTAEHSRDAERISFFELSRDIMVIRSFEDKLVNVNPAFTCILGWTREEVLGHSPTEYVHPDDIQTRGAALDASFAEGGFHTWESRARAKDGSYRWFQWSTTVDEANERAYSTGRDITDMRATLENLRRSERNLAEAQRMTHLGSWSYDPASGVFTLSDEYYRITGHEPGDYSPTWDNIRNCVHPDDRPLIDRGAKIFDGDWLPEPVVVRILRPDGEIRFVQSRVETLHRRGGHPGTIRGTILDITEQIATERRVEAAYEETLEGWARALDYRDQATEGHSRRVTELTIRMAERLGLPREELPHIRRGALLHDIGKVGIPDHILLKPGPLTDEERAVMEKHTLYGWDILAPLEFLQPALDIPHAHHEKWDGTGYPHGLRGEEIPLAARLFALADVWDALTSDRPYRPAWTVEQAREYFVAEAGRHFDPSLVPEFLELVAE